jgi:hypothetical protein
MNYLDDTDFPFTEEELRRAFSLAGGPGEAGQVAGEIANLIAESRRGEKEAAEARARGSTDPMEINAPSWSLGIEVYALLWCLPECSARVDDLMAALWRAAEKSQVRLMRASRGEPVATAPADVVREARRRVAPQRAGWTRRKRAMADRLGVPRPDGSVPSLAPRGATHRRS